MAIDCLVHLLCILDLFPHLGHPMSTPQEIARTKSTEGLMAISRFRNAAVAMAGPEALKNYVKTKLEYHEALLELIKQLPDR